MFSFSRTCIFTLGEYLGSGGFGQVFQATEGSPGAGRVVALKKSRVSLKIKRPALQHEARILQLVHGHTAIPDVYAYGRFEHFEYFAMELLGQSLTDILENENRLPLRTVLLIADQMLSALEHIHARGIIHRDIKPENILLSKDDSRLCLIDFGIARYCPSGEPSRHDPIVERRNIVGTLNWASLNSHHGIDLSRRDDLESLAYTLIFLLRGDLPWKGYTGGSFTVFWTMAQLREQKRAWTGSRLAQGHPAEFGQLLDHARALGFNDQPDYARFRSIFKGRLGLDDWSFFKEDQESAPPAVLPSPKPAPTCTVEPGDFVYVQLLPKITVEGHSAQASDLPCWNDPSLSPDEWRTALRPAIVLDTFIHGGSYYNIKVIPLRRGHPPSDGAKSFVSISTKPRSTPSGTTVAPNPAWPLDDTYCYAFPRVNTFTCVPEETVPICAHWKIHADDVKSLLARFDQPPPPVEKVECSSDPDVRDDARMRMRCDYDVFVRLAPLEPGSLEKTLDGTTVDWMGERGWFDELVRLNKRRSADAGWGWTGTGAADDDEVGEEFSDSYDGTDIADWDLQPERDWSLTLPASETELLDAQIEEITEIMDAC